LVRPRPIGQLDWGALRRLAPVSRQFGLDRGRPVDRYFIERFLRQCRSDIRGRVLEVGDANYTRRIGGDRVTKSDVLHAVEGNPNATLVGDLATGRGIPSGVFDCLIMTQTFQFIYDVLPAVGHAAAALKPGGVLLATVPGISQISRYDMDRWGDYWRFTSLAARKLFAGFFGAEQVAVAAHGNVLAAMAFLQGLAAEELTAEELDYADPDYELVITVRALKRA
jgi:hypothetical protein